MATQTSLMGFFKEDGKTKPIHAPTGSRSHTAKPSRLTLPKPSPPEKLERTEAGREYDAKMAAKADRYRELAAKAQSQSAETYEHARKMADVIPFGQPILVGHYSENADRNYRDRIGRTFDKATELKEKADYYANKADNVESGDIISSDDPDAIVKLNEKIMALEARRKLLKETDDPEKIINSEDKYWASKGRKDLALDSLGRKINDAKKRVAYLETVKAIPASKETINGVEMQIDPSENRIKLIFPSKPPRDTIDRLKRNGWHWSPYNGAWQRQVNNTSIWSAKEILNAYKPEQNQGGS